MANRPSSQPTTSRLPLWHQLRVQVVLLIVILTVIPLLVLTSLATNQVEEQARDQAVKQLESVAELKASQIDRYLDGARDDLDVMFSDPDHLRLFTAILTADGADEALNQQAFVIFAEAVNANATVKEFSLYRADGRIMASSRPERIGQSMANNPVQVAALTEQRVQEPFFDRADNEIDIIATRPIIDGDGLFVGGLAIEINTDPIQGMMLDREGLGTTGETYLVSKLDNRLVTPSLYTDDFPLFSEVRSVPIDRALDGLNGKSLELNYETPPVSVWSVYRWIPELEMALIAERSDAEILQGAESLQRQVRVGALIAGVLVVAIGLAVATTGSRPITHLTSAASSMAAGNLKTRVEINSANEFGLLGTAFNNMADQLDSTVNSLETRVRARTRDLQIAADVARQISTALSLEDVLNRVVELTKRNFNLYHAHVYLLNQEENMLTMEAGAGDAGRIMKEAGHSIPRSAERSLVARAAREGEPVIVNDVQSEPDHLPNPLLPDTRSEMAVPMHLGDSVIGVLDVQAVTLHRFTEDDARVLGTLADQVAVAVQNARFFEETDRSQRLLRSVIDASADWIWAKDRNHRWILANRAFADQALGISPEEAIGKTDADFFTEQLASAFHGDDTAALAGSTLRKSDSSVTFTDGSEHILDTVQSPLFDAEGRIIGTLGVARDVTEQRQARRRQQTAYELGERLSSVLDVETLLKETVRRLGETFTYYHAHVYLYDDAQAGLVVREGLGDAGAALKALGHSIPLEAERSLVARAARTYQPVVVNDVQAEAGHLPNPLLPETRSEVALPLYTGTTLLGVLDVQHDRAEHFNEDEVRTLQIIASQLAVALSNARLFEEAQTALSETAALYAATEQITRSANLDEVLNALVMSSPLGEFDRATISMFDRPWTESQRPNAVIAAAVWERGGEGRAPAGTVFTMAEVPFVQHFARDEPTLFMDITSDPRMENSEKSLFHDRLGMNALAVFPLVIGPQWIGFITGQKVQSTTLADQQVRFIQTLTDQAATVTQNLRLYEEVQSALLQTRSSQELLRSVIDTTPDWIWVKDREHRYITVNRALAENFGMTPEQMLGRSDYDLGLPAELIDGDRTRGVRGTRRDDDTALTGTVVNRMNEISQHQDGTEITLETRRLPLYNLNGDIVGTVGIGTDVTERRRAERRERLAYELGQDMAILFAPEMLLRETITQLHDAMGYYHAHIYRYDETEGLLEMAEGYGEAGEMLKAMKHSIPMDAERSLVARAARTLDAVVVNDVAASPDHLPNPLLPETKAEVALPLFSGQRLLGVLDVQHNILNWFSDAEVRTLRVIGNQLATALSNAELYQEQLQNADRLRELDRLKSEFLANMSHELRTPLNSIIGYSELLIDEVGPNLDDMAEEDLKAIHSSGQHLLALINDVLDLAKIEAGRLELNRSRLTLSTITDPLADSARVLLKDKPEVELQYDMPADLPEIEADTVRLRQILWNLLSNATKFTEAGFVRLSAEVQSGELLVTVQDTGPGIEPRFHQIIFDQFRQADGSATRKAGGAGLGLAITRQLVQLHGGRIWVESAPGAGSTFSFTLPLRRSGALEETEDQLAATGD
jgi:PAS domain S-box-containing protein